MFGPFGVVSRLRLRGLGRLVLVAAIAGAAALTVALATDIGERLEQATLDWRWTLRDDSREDRRIVLIAITDESLARRQVAFPPPRRFHAEVLRRLRNLEPKTIVYGVEFDQEGASIREDERLLREISRTPGVVFPSTTFDDDGPRFLGGGRANREESGATFAAGRDFPDTDGVHRRFWAVDRGTRMPTVAYAAARAFEARPAGELAEPFWVDLPHEPCNLEAEERAGGRIACPTTSFSLRALLDNLIPRQEVKGKLVVVGHTGAALQTRLRTWAGPRRLTTGLEYRAHQIGTILRGFPLTSANAAYWILGVVLMSGLPLLLAVRVHGRLASADVLQAWRTTWPVALAGLAAVAVWTALSTVAFRAGLILPLVAPVAAALAVTVVLASGSGVRSHLAIRGVLAAAATEEILDVIRPMGRAMERSPRDFADRPEEHLRDHLLVALNTQYRGRASAESFNKWGKTDLLLRIQDQNVFIAECKWWSGIKGMGGALEQLYRYATWRDTRLALIFFVPARDPVAIVEKARVALAERSEFGAWESVEHQRELRCRVRWPDDPDRTATLSVLFFHLPRTDARRAR